MKLTTPLVIAGGIAFGALSSLALSHAAESARRSEASATHVSSGATDGGAPLSPEEQQRELYARHRVKIDAHWQEPTDAAWADATRDSFVQGLTRAKVAGKGEFDHVDCRSETCVAEIHYPSFREEAHTFGAYINEKYVPHCGRALFGPPAEDANAPYAATLILDCKADRRAAADAGTGK